MKKVLITGALLSALFLPSCYTLGPEVTGTQIQLVLDQVPS